MLRTLSLSTHKKQVGGGWGREVVISGYKRRKKTFMTFIKFDGGIGTWDFSPCNYFSMDITTLLSVLFSPTSYMLV
jgi:hypothetical protein